MRTSLPEHLSAQRVMQLLLPRKALITLPLVTIAGIALGAAVARDSSVAASSAILWFASALAISAWLSAVLDGLLVEAFGIDGESDAADVVAFILDGVFGVIVGIFVSQVASLDVLQAAGAASAILFIQTLLIDRLIMRNAIGNAFVKILQGGGGTQPDYSYAASLAMRGDMVGARAAYEKAIAADPKNPMPYRAFAQMLRLHARDRAGALRVLQRALDRTRMDEQMRSAILREMKELR